MGEVMLCCALCDNHLLVCCSLKLRYAKIRACVEQVFGEAQKNHNGRKKKPQRGEKEMDTPPPDAPCQRQC